MFPISRVLRVTTKPRLHWNSLYHHHGQKQQPPSPPTFYLSRLCTNLPSLKTLHASFLIHGLTNDLLLSTKLLSLYASFGQLRHARKIFNHLPTRDLYCFKVMIRAYFLNDTPSGVVSLYRLMRLSLHPTPHDYVLFSIVFKSCAESRDFQTLTITHCHFVKSLPSDSFVLTCLVDAYAKFARVDEATRAFDEIHENDDVVSWTSMIVAYVQNDCAREGLTLFNRMREAFVDGNEFTVGSLVSACTKLNWLHQGKWVHGFVIKNGICVNSYLTTSLLNMYVKCGNIQDACKVFDESSSSSYDRDLVSWTAMIVGYSQRGYPHLALELFKDKKWSGILPNSHYACMVDMLARAGNLEEALDFIERMPVQPSVSVFGAFLHGCGLHSRFELGGAAIKKMLELHPDEACYYVLVSNLYASDGRWGMVKQVREMIKQRGLNKVPGCSSVEMDLQNDSYAKVAVVS
ncbi:Pentatricopeptide repeat-containing protein, mitochondrial [Glycine max]|nr:Pentatricopeptide repeat-containing protein, mitochondrial [Glycine max]